MWVVKFVVYYIVFIVLYDKIYFGVLFYVYVGNYGVGCYKGVCFYRKGRVFYSKNINVKNFIFF